MKDWDCEDCENYQNTIAVYLCFLVTAFRGRGGLEMTAEAAIAAIICMQPYVHEVRLRTSYHSERDAMHLLHMVERRYAPVRWPWKRRH